MQQSCVVRYFNSPEADELLEGARAETQPNIRQLAYRRFENLMLESGTLIPLFHDVGYRLASPKIRGVRLSSVSPYVNYAELGKQEAVATIDSNAGGGVLVVPMSGGVTTLDPSQMPKYEDSEIRNIMFETLLRDVGGARIEPWLAEEYHREDDGRRYRFKLREGVRFHDGRSLSARDVRYSLERLIRQGQEESSWLYLPIVGAKDLQLGKTDELVGLKIESLRDFTIDLEEPISYLPVLLASDVVTIIPDGSEDFAGTWKSGVVGTGPFRVTRFVPDKSLELERNPNYWRPGFPKCDGLEFNFGIPSEEILSGFRPGKFSLASDLFPRDAEELRRSKKFGPGYREVPALITFMAAFNVHQGPLKDRELRKRLVSSVDVDRIVKQALGHVAQPATGLIPPGLLGHDPRQTPQTGLGSGSASRAAADEVELTVAMHPIFDSEYKAFATALMQELRNAGIVLKPVTETMDDFLEATAAGSVDVYLGRWVADYADSDSFAYILNSRDGFLARFCGLEEVDELIDSGRVVPDPATRHQIYRRLEGIIARDVLLLPLFHEQIYRFARPEVEGLTVSYSAPAVQYDELRVRKR